MKFYKIEVDEEVYGYIKSKAEPLVDTVNSVLRRELPLKEKLIDHPASAPRRSNGAPSNLPPGTPAALRQILLVVNFVVDKNYSRTQATQVVAEHLNVAPQTVLDKYCRQLGLRASEFDRLLEQPGLPELKVLLAKKFGYYNDTIDQFLG